MCTVHTRLLFKPRIQVNQLAVYLCVMVNTNCTSAGIFTVLLCVHCCVAKSAFDFAHIHERQNIYSCGENVPIGRSPRRERCLTHTHMCITFCVILTNRPNYEQTANRCEVSLIILWRPFLHHVSKQNGCCAIMMPFDIFF